MGTLVAKAYPTSLAADAADHTYVECGAGGKAWGCWGGKTGGRELGHGTGSTKRADAIAGSDERAGIACYLVNGVCHQAANRILLPASMTVSTARGYWVSESIFGTYGRVGAWRCHAPFHKHAGVSGDLAECRSALPATGGRDAAAEASEKQKRERDYLQGVLKLYAAAEDGRRPRSETLADVQEFQQTLFLHMVQFRLGALLNEELSRRLREVNARAEAARSKLYSARRGKVVAVHEYVEAFNRETIKFQEEMANALSAEQYEALFGLKPGEAIVLADPEIVKKAARE